MATPARCTRSSFIRPRTLKCQTLSIDINTEFHFGLKKLAFFQMVVELYFTQYHGFKCVKLAVLRS